MLKLEIDNREPLSIKEYFIENCKTIDCELKNLEQGDFIIRDLNENILLLIERKSISDLLASVKDKRYTEQCQRYSQLNIPNSKIYFIIEGNLNNIAKNSTNYKTLYSCIFSLSYKKEFSVIFTNNINETNVIIKEFLERLHKLEVEKSKENDIINEKNKENSSIKKKDLDEKNDLNEKNDLDEKNEKNENQEIVEIENSTLSTLSTLSLLKKQTVTKENINNYMLNLVPGVGITTAEEILKSFDGKIYNLINLLKTEPDKLEEKLNNIKIKSRKLSKKIIKNIKEYL